MTKAKIKNAISELKSSLIVKFGNSTELILFGSAATGNYGEESDIDILVLVPFDTNNTIEEEIFRQAFEIELKYDIVFGIIVYSKTFWNSALASAMPLHKNIQSHGINL